MQHESVDFIRLHYPPPHHYFRPFTYPLRMGSKRNEPAGILARDRERPKYSPKERNCFEGINTREFFETIRRATEMKKRTDLSPAVFAGIMAIIIFSFAFCGCIILQNQKAYEKYTKNTNWDFKK